MSGARLLWSDQTTLLLPDGLSGMQPASPRALPQADPAGVYPAGLPPEFPPPNLGGGILFCSGLIFQVKNVIL